MSFKCVNTLHAWIQIYTFLVENAKTHHQYGCITNVFLFWNSLCNSDGKTLVDNITMAHGSYHVHCCDNMHHLEDN